MFDDENPTGDNSSPRKTIVGGRPPESQTDLPPIPSGIQRLLRYAAQDDGFRSSFLAQRAEAAAAAGIELTASERAILAAVPVTQLEAMLAQVKTQYPKRREFLRQTTASAAVLLGGVAFAQGTKGCDKPAPATRESPRPTHKEMLTEGGAAPSMPLEEPDPSDSQSQPQPEPTAPQPPVRPQQNDTAVGGGIRPDRPNQPLSPTRGIQPDLPPERPDAAVPRSKP